MRISQVIPRVDSELGSKTVRLLAALTQHLALPFSFVGLMALFYPIRERFGDFDEGINLMKSLLVLRGHTLYSEIWSDQPPLFTHVLSLAIRFLGYRVGGIRLIVLLFSAILLWAAMQYIRRVWGAAHALGSVLLILLIPSYLELSTDIKVGLPALSFAMLSLLTLTGWHQERKDRWLVLSAIALSLSVLTKLFTGMLAPIFTIGVLIDQYHRTRAQIRARELLRPAVVWGTVFTGVTVVLGLLLVGPANLSQLIENHLDARASEFYRLNRELTIAASLGKGWIILFLALPGSIFMYQSRRWLTLYPLVWATVAYLLLSQHAPVWSHQHLLVAVPAAILAGVAVVEALHSIPQIIRSGKPQGFRGMLSLATLLGLTVLIVVRMPPILNTLKLQPTLRSAGLRLSATEHRFIDIMEEYADETRWIVTDRPIYAFRAGLSVPPHLAAFTEKRWVTGNLTEEHVLNTIRELEPKQVLFGRFSFPTVERYLEPRYELVHSKPGLKLYIRNE